MEMKETLEAMRTEMASRDERTSEQFQALRAEVQEVRKEVHAGLQGVRAEVQDLRTEVHTGFQGVRTELQDMRKEIQGVRIFKYNRLGLAIAAVVGIAVVGTFVLQLLDAIF